MKVLLLLITIMLLGGCSKPESSGQVMEATSQALACTSIERLKQIAVYGAAKNQVALMAEISKSRNVGECQWLFVGNQVAVYELGDIFAKIANPRNDFSKNERSESVWYVISDQAAFKLISLK